MTREEARQVERQLMRRYPGDTVEVTRVFGGVEVAAGDKRGWVFLRAADDSPLLALLTASPEAEPGDLPGECSQPGGHLFGRIGPAVLRQSGSLAAGRLLATLRCACQVRRVAGVQAGRPSLVLVSPGMGWRVRARRKLSAWS
jgi:hypothetical protein